MKKNFYGHQENWNFLKQAMAEGRLAHALLFMGPEGIGKQQVAQALAALLLETEHLEQHLDFYRIEPETGRIKIEAIRAIKKNFAFAPLQAKRRVILVQDAHTMNSAAANGLLKSLEEPPAETYFILITHALGWLPRTITSRCQKINFHPLKEDALSTLLKEQEIELSPEYLKQAQGSLAQAKQLAQVAADLPSLRNLLPSSQALDFLSAQELAEKIVEQEKTEAFLQGLLMATHQVLMGERKSPKYDFDLLHFADRIVQLKNNLKLNLNPKLQLTRLLLHFQEPKENRL